MMKHLLLVSLLVLIGAGSAGAAEVVIFDKVAHREDRDYMNYVCSIESKSPRMCNVTEAALKPDHCLAKMEAAMKAAHPFLMLDLPPVGEQIGLDLVKKTDEWRYEARLPREDLEGLTPEGLANTLNAKAGRAIVLWDTVKRECWREP